MITLAVAGDGRHHGIRLASFVGDVGNKQSSSQIDDDAVRLQRQNRLAMSLYPRGKILVYFRCVAMQLGNRRSRRIGGSGGQGSRYGLDDRGHDCGVEILGLSMRRAAR
jgi:hypothetical protein